MQLQTQKKKNSTCRIRQPRVLHKEEDLSHRSRKPRIPAPSIHSSTVAHVRMTTTRTGPQNCAKLQPRRYSLQYRIHRIIIHRPFAKTPIAILLKQWNPWTPVERRWPARGHGLVKCLGPEPKLSISTMRTSMGARERDLIYRLETCNSD
jgi:hypothetical protein